MQCRGKWIEAGSRTTDLVLGAVGPGTGATAGAVYALLSLLADGVAPSAVVVVAQRVDADDAAARLTRRAVRPDRAAVALAAYTNLVLVA